MKWGIQDLSSGQPPSGTIVSLPAPYHLPLCFHGKPRCPESTTISSEFPHPDGGDAYLPDTSAGNLTSIHTSISLYACFLAHVYGALRYLHRLLRSSQDPTLQGKVLFPYFIEEKTEAHGVE